MNSEIQIPGFNLKRPLSSGASAEVYLADQISPQREVALKLVPLKQGLDESFVKRLQNEGNITARFTHQNLVTVYACGIVDDHYFLAMEYLPGGDLASRIATGLNQEQIIGICRELATGLDYIHQRGAIHRDIKPANVMFNEEGRAVLVDFGIAKLQTADSTLTRMGLRSGTPSFMSPEQAQGKKMDGRSDLYSLGIMLYEMLTGSTPFTGEDDIAIAYSHVHERARPLPAKFAHFQALVNKLIAKQPDKRFGDAQALIKALEQLKPRSDDQVATRTGEATALIKATSQDWWHEMQQRRVFRVAAIYFVLAWGFTEISTTILEGFNAPRWTITTILMLFVLGFPVAIVLAWLFEIGPDGIRRTPPASGRGIFAIMLSISLVITATGLAVWFPDPGDTAGFESAKQSVTTNPVVAVLPFRDRSPDQSLAFLGDGLAEELLNRLARADGIKTIGRTSSFLLAAQDLTITEIAGKLKADLIVEGNIRVQGELLVISVSLIDSLNGQTQWADTYKELMSDVFDVQERIARLVIGEITGVQDANVDAGRIGTKNSQAYQLYLRAHHGLHNAIFIDDEIAAKREQLKQAIALDPAFALAYLDLAYAYYMPTWISEERDHPFMELAANFVRQAIQIESDLVAAHAMMANIETLRYNWESSFAAYERAVVLSNGPPAVDSLAFVNSTWGYLQKSLEISLAWYERDSVDPAVTQHLANMYAMTGQLDQTLKYMAIRKELGSVSNGWEIYFLIDNGHVELARAMWIEWWGDEPSDVAPCFAELCNANSWFELMLEANSDPSVRAAYIAKLGNAVTVGWINENLLLFEYVQIQATDKVFEIAQSLWEKRMLNLSVLWHLRGGPIREDPRFLELMESIGLVEFWKAHGPPDFCEPDGDTFVCS